MTFNEVCILQHSPINSTECFLPMQVQAERCFDIAQLADIQYHVVVPYRPSPHGLPIFGMLRAQLTSDVLAQPASYEAPIASANTAVQVPVSICTQHVCLPFLYII